MPSFTAGNSARWRIFQTVATALERAPELQGVPVKRNPSAAVSIKRGDYMVIVRWDADTQRERVSTDERRAFRLVVGSVASTLQSDADADAMHEVVGHVLRGVMPSLNSLCNVKELVIEEQEVTPDLEGLLIEGALVLSVYQVTYRQPAFALRRP
jgi:hypothetical protein